MAGLTFNISLEGLEEAVNELQAPLENLRPMLLGVGMYFEGETKDRFRSNVSPDGSAWDESARAKEEGGKTLLDRGHLRDSIHTVVAGDSVEVGTNLVYAAIHQFGGTTRPHKITAKNGGVLAWGGNKFAKSVNHPGSVIPPRPYLGIASGDEAEVELLVADHWGIS